MAAEYYFAQRYFGSGTLFPFPTGTAELFMQGKTLIYFGNENLQKGIFNVSNDGSRNASPQIPQDIPLARATGSSVVNTRRGAKTISLNGYLNVDTVGTPDNLQELIRDYDAIFETDEEQYLRFVNEYINIIQTAATVDWNISDDAANLTQATDKWQNPVANSCIGFDIDVSASVNDYATLTYGSSSPVDLSGQTDTGNFEFALYIPDTFYITSVDLRVGNDASNYYTGNSLTDYQGKTLSNGWNVISYSWDNPAGTFPRAATRVSEVGTVDDSDIKYFQVKINYSSDAEDITGCRLDSIMWVNEDRVRNFPCFVQGELQKTGDHYEITHTNWSCNFLNHSGYANGTHLFELFDEQNIITSTNDQSFDPEGSINPLPVIIFDITDSTNLGDFNLTNLETGENLTLEPASVSDGDLITFGGLGKQSQKNGQPLDFSGIIPSFKLGKNRIRLSLAGGVTSLIEQTIIDSERYGQYTLPTLVSGDVIAQSFTADLSGPLSYVEFNIKYTLGFGSGSATVAVYSDSAGYPGALIESGTITGIGSSASWKRWTPTSTTLVSGTKYWLYMNTPNGYFPVTWSYNTAGGYAGGEVKQYNGASWDPLTGDQTFKLQIGQNPAWDLDWQMGYRKLYAS